MAKRQILPAVISYRADLAGSISAIEACGADAECERTLLGKIGAALKVVSADIDKLEKALADAAGMHGDTKKQAEAYRDLVFAAMGDLRSAADSIEPLVDSEYWPMPTYTDLLFRI
jgi:glutamine synthetase